MISLITNKQNVKEEYEGEARQWNQSHKHLLKLDNEGGTTYQLMSQRQKLERLAGKSQGTLSVRRLLPRVDLVNVASVLKLRSACVSCGIRDQTPAEGLVITLQFLWVMSSDSGIQMPSTGEMSVFTGTLDIGGPSPLDMEYFDQDDLQPAIVLTHCMTHCMTQCMTHNTRLSRYCECVYIHKCEILSLCVQLALSSTTRVGLVCTACSAVLDLFPSCTRASRIPQFSHLRPGQSVGLPSVCSLVFFGIGTRWAKLTEVTQ